jgi:hypothetical protein
MIIYLCPEHPMNDSKKAPKNNCAICVWVHKLYTIHSRYTVKKFSLNREQRRAIYKVLKHSKEAK